MELISSLIKSKKLVDYQSTYPKINKLGLEIIEIAKICPNEIRKLLDPEKEYIKKYIIKEKKDLLDMEKICFYFFLLKYIVKNYFYNIPFLLETRKLIIKLLKENELFFNDKQNEITDKREYIIKQLLNSEYYFRPIPDKDINKLKAVLNYYKELFFESKKDDIIKLENIIKNKRGYYKRYIDDYNAEKMNLKLSIIKLLFNSKNKIIYNEKKRNEKIETIEKLINEKNIEKIREEDLQLLIKYFRDNKNKESLINVFNEKIYNYFINIVTALLMLDESTIIFYINNIGIEKYKIFFGLFKNYINYNELEDIYNYCNNHQKEQNNYLIMKNYILYFEFLKKIEQNIINNKFNASILNIKIELKNNKNNNEFNDLINNAKFTPYSKCKVSMDDFNSKIREIINEYLNNHNKIKFNIKEMNSTISNYSNIEEKCIIKNTLSNGCSIVEIGDEIYAKSSLNYKERLEISNLKFIKEREFSRDRTGKKIQLIIISNNKLSTLNIEFIDIKIKSNIENQFEINENKFKDLIEINDHIIILYEENDVHCIVNLFSNYEKKKFSIKDEKCINELKIDRYKLPEDLTREELSRIAIN